MLYNGNDNCIGRSLELYGEWGEAELRLLGTLIRPGSVVVDVGANIGTHSLFFSQAVGPAGRVLSFEPDRLLFQQLCANMALNSLTNVQPFNMAAGASAGTIHLTPLDPTVNQNFGGVRLEKDGSSASEVVSVVQIDALGLPSCRLIKVDTEGMELDVINGASQTILAHNPVLYLENNLEEKSGPLISRVRELGYHLYWHFSPLFLTDNYFECSENIFGSVVDTNMLALPAAIDGLLPVSGPDDDHVKAAARYPAWKQGR